MKATGYFSLIALMVMLSISCRSSRQRLQQDRIDLAGEWAVVLDSNDVGIEKAWFKKSLSGSVRLPGSLVENGLGNDISVNTKWTGTIIDSSWYTDEKYAPYRQPGNIKIPFWLQPQKHYIGAAWYQKKIKIPKGRHHKRLHLILERCHWQTQLWLDDEYQGMQNSLSTPHIYDLGTVPPGKHRLTLCVDNRLKVKVGQNAHSVSDHTQGNWNGIVGDLYLKAVDPVYIEDLQIYTDTQTKQISLYIRIYNHTSQAVNSRLQLSAATLNADPVHNVTPLQRDININPGDTEFRVDYDMGAEAYLWDEFSPVVYQLDVDLTGADFHSHKNLSFGMRRIATDEGYFTINGRRTFLRGTLECAIFPKTGYPAMDRGTWMRIFHICKEHGLNHMRFHSWCPPEAAFEAADRSGVYLQVECAVWPNQGATLGDGEPVDAFIQEESERIAGAYGNHPSFCMLATGNEPAGESMDDYLRQWVRSWQAKDDRRLYTGASGWPILKANDFHVTPSPRLQQWGAGLSGIINGEPPQTTFNYKEITGQHDQPVVSHETGQWCVYPDFREIDQYTGVFRAKNFEIFRSSLQQNQLGDLADDFLMASARLQALCYKADIEAILRTPGMAGFQLLQLHDFPGQGTALVGILNAFWQQKGYILPEEFRRFCNITVPLAELPKRIFLSGDTLQARIIASHFGPHPLLNIKPRWRLTTGSGRLVAADDFRRQRIDIGNDTELGRINTTVADFDQPTRLNLEVTIGESSNSWDLWVYPDIGPVRVPDYILITSELDYGAERALLEGKNVLLTLPAGAVAAEKGGDVAVGFSPIFWNTAWTAKQAPHTLGILCDPAHPALRQFSTQSHSNRQWWEPLQHAQAIVLDHVEPRPKVIVRLIDDWFSNRSLALVAEIKVGMGKLILCGINLNQDLSGRTVSRQLKRSLVSYMSSPEFQPQIEMSIEQIKDLYR